ncbi:FixH family protein [Lentzea sp. NPDC059081]|uniref:FixH family protein n=1 Tax=Lentzea sp. NPDC059081 TaxID=3346719 RepID=UPI0036A958AC
MTRTRVASLVAVAALAAVTTGCGARPADAGAPTETCTETKTGSGLSIDLTTPCPLRGGKSADARITVKNDKGEKITNATVKLTPDMPSMNMHSGEQNATPNGDGYDAKLVLGMGGEWIVKVQVTPSSGSPADVSFTLNAK